MKNRYKKNVFVNKIEIGKKDKIIKELFFLNSYKNYGLTYNYFILQIDSFYNSLK